MTGPVRRFRALPIRARLSLLVAAAVAFAVAAVSVTCWFIVQGKLYEQVDEDLKKATVLQGPQRVDEIRSALTDCTDTPATAARAASSTRTRRWSRRTARSACSPARWGA